MWKDLTGARVAVYWSDDDEYYEGLVTKQQNDGSFYVEYDDGDKEKAKYKLLKRNGTEPAHQAEKKKSLLLQVTCRAARVSVWWPLEKQYYDATVVKIRNCNKNPHYLEYDDGDTRRTNLARLKFRMLNPSGTFK